MEQNIPHDHTDHRDRFRVYTHNVFGMRADWPRRRDVLKKGIAALDPDIALLQETIVTGVIDQVAEIMPGYHIVHSRVREDDGQGISIASRWPVSQVQELDLEQVSNRTAAFACTALLVEVTHPWGPLLVVNHFPDYQPDHEGEREAQSCLVVEAIHARGDVPALLGGDLDAERDAASVRFLAGKQSLHGINTCFVNTWDAMHPGQPCHTFSPTNPLVPSGWPFSQIDHIFVKCGTDGHPSLRIAACERVFAAAIDGVWASDHAGLVADLRVR